MERKNMVLLTVIAVATLLVAVVGATFAYFTATVTDNRDSGTGQGTTSIETSKIASTTTVANIDGEAGKFTAEDVYPGHKEIAAVKVSVSGASGDTSRIAFNYNVTENTIGEDINVTIYRANNDTSALSITEDGNWFKCEKKSKPKTESEDGTMLYYEECDASRTSQLTTSFRKIGETKTISTVPHQDGPTSATVFQIATDVITLEDASKDVNYYVVIEFENSDDEQSDQNEAMAKKLDGTITITGA